MKFGIREKTGFILAIYIAVILFWYLFFYSPRKNKLKSITKDINRITIESNYINEDIFSIKSESDKEKSIFKKYNEIKKKLPQKGAISSILIPIRQIGQTKQIRIRSIQPTMFQLDGNKEEGDKFSLEEIPVKILLEGKFIDVGQYLFDLADLPFFGGYKNMQMKMSEMIYPEIEAEITCIFLFLEQDEALSG